MVILGLFKQAYPNKHANIYAKKYILKRLRFLSPVFCNFRGGWFSSTFHKTTENGLNGNFCSNFCVKLLKMTNLDHFKWFSGKVAESGLPLKWLNTGG